MAKHDQSWRDARWKQKKRQRDAESKRREWELSEFARQADEALEHMRQFSDWAEPMIERLDFLKEIGSTSRRYWKEPSTDSFRRSTTAMGHMMSRSR